MGENGEMGWVYLQTTGRAERWQQPLLLGWLHTLHKHFPAKQTKWGLGFLEKWKEAFDFEP